MPSRARTGDRADGELPLQDSNLDYLIQRQGLSHRAAVHRLGVAQPDLSNLCRGRLDGFSIERLCRLLTATRA